MIGNGIPESSGAFTWTTNTTPQGSGAADVSTIDSIQGVVPSTITLSEGVYMIASIYDDNYLPYTAPTGPATWNRPVDANATTDPLIDVQGTLSTTGVSVLIPVTTTGNGILGGATFTIVIPAAHTEDGQSRTIELSWPATSFTTSTKTIVATLKSIGGPLNVKKLDLNDGLGDDSKGVLVGTFTFEADHNGTQKNFEVRAISGIPDRCFGKTTLDCIGYGSTELEHQFLYMPIQGPDGKTWLNNNLGAEYARVGSSYFNPIYQAGALDASGNPIANPTANQIKKDFRAYGSLYQWQRKSDGHELIDWASSSVGTPVYSSSVAPTMSSSWTTPDTNLWINGELSSFYSWVEDVVNTQTSNHNLWNPNGGVNNPCPYGYHVPSLNEVQTVHTSISGATGANTSSNSNMWNERVLRLPAAGFRHADTGNEAFDINHGYYWTSESHSDIKISGSLMFSDSTSNSYQHYRAHGFSVRCLQD